MADYLASSDALQVDGILFPSVQRGADREDLNVVLFRKASTVEALPIPTGTKIDSRSGEDTEDGWEVGFSVIESRPDPEVRAEGAATREVANSRFDQDLMSFDDGNGLRSDHIETLRVCCESLHVHIVKAVRVEHEAHSVSRHIWYEGTATDF